MACLTLLWQRNRLATLALKHVLSIRAPGVELLPIAVYSREDEERHGMITIPGVQYVQHHNNLLSDKWNAGALVAKEMGVDALMIFGSDDFFNAKYVSEVSSRLKAVDYVATKSLYFYDALTGEAIYARNVGRCGAGRTLSGNLLDRCDWQPWVYGFTRYTDGAMDTRLQMIEADPPETIEDIREIGAVMVDVKTEVNAHPFANMKRALECEIVDRGEIFEQLPGCGVLAL